MEAAKQCRLELVGGPLDGSFYELEDPQTDDVFEVTHRGRNGKEVLLYEVETDPGIDTDNWAIYRGLARRRTDEPTPGEATAA